MGTDGNGTATAATDSAAVPASPLRNAAAAAFGYIGS